MPIDNYASSFGFQWNLFKGEQLDSRNGTTLSRDRFLSETGSVGHDLSGQWVLDVGCGAGRFLDVASTLGCDVVGVDLSNSVDAARKNLEDRANVHLIQASAFDLPFKKGVFDGCYCIGVAQHTPNPTALIAGLPSVVRPSGWVAITAYERNRFTRFAGKYLVRRLTRRVSPAVLLRVIRATLPLLFVLTEILFRIPIANRLFRFLIPVSNYVGESQLSVRERYRWAMLDTFDALAPAYDQPLTFDEIDAALSGAGVGSVVRLPNSGVNVLGYVTGSDVGTARSASPSSVAD